jgi:hypothetical protein
MEDFMWAINLLPADRLLEQAKINYKLAEELNASLFTYITLGNLSSAYYKLNNIDSTLLDQPCNCSH